MERNYSDKILLKEIPRVVVIPRDAYLEKVNNQEKKNKTFNITFHPDFWNEIKILEELHVTVASDYELKVFPDAPIGFKIDKNLKAHLVRSQLPDLDEVGSSKPCGGKRPCCHLCKNKKC